MVVLFCSPTVSVMRLLSVISHNPIRAIDIFYLMIAHMRHVQVDDQTETIRIAINIGTVEVPITDDVTEALNNNEG